MPPWWQKNPRRVVTPDRPPAEQHQPDWPQLPGWNAMSPVERMEDELIDLRARIANLETAVRLLAEDIDRHTHGSAA